MLWPLLLNDLLRRAGEADAGLGHERPQEAEGITHLDVDHAALALYVVWRTVGGAGGVAGWGAVRRTARPGCRRRDVALCDSGQS